MIISPTLSSPQSGSPGNQTIGGLVVVVVVVVVVAYLESNQITFS
jgi:hypothetical protein